MFKKIFFLFTVLFISQNLNAQETTLDNTLSVYLDCRGCNSSFIRSEIGFINFVRDQADADVHLIITRQGTGSGGTQYTLNYIGQNTFNLLTDELIYTSYDSDTDEEERNGLVQYVKLGLISFLSEIDALSNFNLSYLGNNNSISNLAENDKWNSWIFEIGANTWFNGEESESTVNLDGRFRVRRITDEWKIQLNYDQNYRRETQRDTEEGSEEIYTRGRQNVFGLVAYSLSDHWSLGSYFSGGASTRENINLRYGATPTVEYSFYPYREFARREVTFRYGVFTSFYDYTERTIFGKENEILTRQELAFNMDYTKPWGAIESRLNARSYLHDFSKNRVNMDFEIDIRIVRGFSVFFEVGYSIINDQLSLSAEGVTDKEALADTRQRETSYDFNGSIGFEITFGSIYDNVVNTRF
ncbi:MAG: hypothetical protein RLN90_14805 [Balneolaceae bacterium]